MKIIIILGVLISNIVTAQFKEKELLIPYRENNLWGFCDSIGNIKVKPFAIEIKNLEYDIFTPKSRFVIREKDTNYYVINNLQQALIPKKNDYDSLQIRKFDSEEIYVFKNEKMGVYKNGKEILACLYENISTTSNNSFIVKKEGFYGLFNSIGKQIIPFEYKYITHSEKNNDNNAKFIWKASKQGICMDCKQDEFYDAKIKDNKESPHLDQLSSKGRVEVSDATISKVEQFLTDKYDYFKIDRNDNLIFVNKGRISGVLSLIDGKEIVKPDFEEVDLFISDGEDFVFKIRKADKYGLVNKNKIIVPLKYEKIERTFEGLNLLINGNKQGFFNFEDKRYVDSKYKQILKEIPVNISFGKNFNIYKVVLENAKEGYVGENGIEYFK